MSDASPFARLEVLLTRLRTLLARLEPLLARLEPIALVAVGAVAGANLRYLATGALSEFQGLILANVLGSVALGFLVYEVQYVGALDRRARLCCSTGFLSSLTTYSAFAFYAATAGEPRLLLAFVAGNYGLGFAGVVLGREVARRLGEGESGSEGGTPPVGGDDP